MSKIKTHFSKNKITYVKAAVCLMMVSAVSFAAMQLPESTQEVVVEEKDTKKEEIKKTEEPKVEEPVEEETVEDEVAEQPVVDTAPAASQAAPAQTKNNIQYQNNTQQNTYTQSNGSGLTKQGGVNWHNGNKETYYNLDMSGVVSNAQSMGIQGEYWVRDDGVKMYGDKVIVAAQMDKGTVIDTSLGTGIVLDYCPAGTVDIAVTW